LMQEKKKDNEKWITKGSLLIPIDSGKEFVRALNKILNSKRTGK